VAAALKNEPDVRVSVVDGSPGELTIRVDGEEVARKGEAFPEINDVVAAVRQSGTAADAQRR
jgi:hypothetical protein